jgi:hypothetical protein
MILKIPPKSINHHENDFIERWGDLRVILVSRPCRQSGEKSFMGKEASSKNDDRANGQNICEKA